MLTDSLKLLIRRSVFNNAGLEVNVYMDEASGEIYVKQMVKVTKKPVGVNQIELIDAKCINPNAKAGDYLEIKIEDNEMINQIIEDCIQESTEAESKIRRKAELINDLKTQGVVDYSLIMAKYEHDNLLGESLFKYKDKYPVIMDKNKKMAEDVFIEGAGYPMIITSFEERDDNIIIRASRTTNNFIEELLRLSLVTCNYPIEIKKVCRETNVLTKVLVDIIGKEEDPDKFDKLSPAGIVVGPKGSRIKDIEKYINNEKIEIVNYNPSTPIQILSVVDLGAKNIYFNFETPEMFKNSKIKNNKKALVVVSDSYIGKAIGKNGVSLKLSSNITGWMIQLISETDFNVKFPDGVTLKHIDFDWYGLENELFDCQLRFYSYYLSKNGFNSLVDLKNVDVNDFNIPEFSVGDCKFLINLVNSLDFSITCPKCGENIDSDDYKCKSCGLILE